MAVSGWQPNGVFDSETGLPICQPLKTYEDVLGWNPTQDHYSVASIRLPSIFKNEKNRRKTLICHDMDGGYLDDRFIQGVLEKDCYRFCYWQHIDSFIYFSHYFVTIPPPAWTNAAHKHGVSILGTLITEWDDGKKRFQQIIASEKSYREFADKLIAISNYFGFDGWLVNIENKVETEEIPNLRGFLEYLREKLHQSNSHSQVIWYDSVIETGKLEWQNELNEKNKCFFDATDAIFLNYTWKPENLQNSASIAIAENRPYDVYVGVDVFGRGCPGGGGFNTKEAISAAFQNDLSVAIFAQGWTWEKFAKEEFTENEIRFWKDLQSLCPGFCSVTLPFCTSFCQGFGNKLYQNGKVLLSKPWSNLSVQNLQPLWAQKGCNGETKNGFKVYMEDVFNGGCSVKFFTDLKEKTQESHRLFDLHIKADNPLLVSYTFKMISEQEHVNLQLCLCGQDKKSRINTQYLLCENGASSLDARTSDEIGKEFLHPLPPSDLNKHVSEHLLDKDTNGWKTRFYYLPLKGAVDFKSLDINVASSPQTQASPLQVEFLVGQIQILHAKDAKLVPLLTNLKWSEIEETECDEPASDQDSATLTWNYLEEFADHFNIFHSENSSAEDSHYTFIGHTHLRFFKIPKAEISGIYKVQPINKSGFNLSLKNLPFVEASYYLSDDSD